MFVGIFLGFSRICEFWSSLFKKRTSHCESGVTPGRVWSFFLSHNGTQTSICAGNKPNCLLKAAAGVLSFASGSGYSGYTDCRSLVLYPTPSHMLRMRDRSDAITGEIQTHSSDIPLHVLVIVYGRTEGSRKQTQDKLLSQQELELKLISVAGFHSKSKNRSQDIIVKRQMSC